jgi:hypothetical protein
MGETKFIENKLVDPKAKPWGDGEGVANLERK